MLRICHTNANDLMGDSLILIEIITAIISIVFLVRTWVMFDNIKDIRDFLLKDYDVPRGQFLLFAFRKMNAGKEAVLKIHQVVTRKDQQDEEFFEIVAIGPEVSYVRSTKNGKEYAVNNDLLVPYEK